MADKYIKSKVRDVKQATGQQAKTNNGPHYAANGLTYKEMMSITLVGQIGQVFGGIATLVGAGITAKTMTAMMTQMNQVNTTMVNPTTPV